MVRHTNVTQARIAGQAPAGQVSVPVFTPAAVPAPAPVAVPVAPVATPVAQLPDPLADLKAKFAQLSAVTIKLKSSKPDFAEKEALLEELLPLFVVVTPTDIIIHREITIGNEKHTIVPLFIDPDTGLVRSKVFKASMTETFTIR